MNKAYDAIVIGLGIMGSAALSYLARAGASVLGIDQFSPPHDRGSSHGETRLLRVAYAEGEAYVPMMRRSVLLWRELEARTNASLFTQSGVLYLAPRDSSVLASVEASAARHGIELADARASDRTKLFNIPHDWRALFEPGAGFLNAEASVAAFLADAQARGAQIRPDCRSFHIEQSGNTLVLHTASGEIRARRVICSIGAWARGEFAFLQRLLKLEQHILHWHEASEEFEFGKGFSPFVVAPNEHQFLYGFARGNGLVKLADHYSGAPLAAPSALGTRVPAREFAHMDALVRAYLPRLGERRSFKPCIYAQSPDEHFILDEHPEIPGVFFLAGLSGHGFKFAPVLGEALANLALGQPQQIDTGFFSLKRFA